MTDPAADKTLEAFTRRLQKMARHFGRWARRTGVHAYRVYDRDVPGARYAIDVFELERTPGFPLDGRAVHVHVFASARAGDDERTRPAALEPVLSRTAELLGIERTRLFVKHRRRQKDMRQYQRLGARGREGVVREGGLRFIVELGDRLDVGLFLDHRLSRELVREHAAGKRVLNLFAYTGSFTVYAAAGGARASTTVDLSSTYLAWAQRNLALNGIATGGAHRLVRADVLAWLEQQREARYDLIVLDPPTHSRSKRMRGDFAIERDHVRLIERAARLLTPGGRIFFSTNYRRFRLDAEALSARFALREITRRTTPPDFRRHPPHRAWWIEPTRRLE